MIREDKVGMKILHCADLHLDSKLNTHLDTDSAKERKAEILHTFERMVSYASKQDIYVILIAGDLFDKTTVSATARNTVLKQITDHTNIHFYYLKGNHDSCNFLTDLEELPQNLFLFDESWRTYREGKVAITAIELTEENTRVAMNSLQLSASDFNIVMLHGQEGDLVPIRELRNRGIDYLALGHIHAYKKEALDNRGSYCYPGCLDPRGFDECGEHGFVVLDIDETTGKYTHDFVPFASRKAYCVSVDVTDCLTTAQMMERTDEALTGAGCDENSLVRIVLEGVVDVECEKDLDYLYSRYKNRYYVVRVVDETKLKMDIHTYLLDQSLKGEYVRRVMADDTLTEEAKTAIVRYGLQAIAGEEVQ